jgi:effector-binding domain-containing protein
METLPEPNNPIIELKEIPEMRFAVIRFAGMAGEESLRRYSKELDDFLSAKRLTPLSPPIFTIRPGRSPSCAATSC